MSTHPESSGSSQSTAPKQQGPPPPPPPPPPGSSLSFPKLTIFRAYPAWNSPQVDERCFVYCSQTSHNRARGRDAWCRTICFRRVFGHEVHDGSYDASQDPNRDLRPRGPLPLPHEGQPREAMINDEVEDTDKTRYWKEGSYIWVSKSRWGAQEKLDLMKASLPQQTSWMRHKEELERERYEDEMECLREQIRMKNEGGAHAEQTGPEDHDQQEHDPEPLPPPRTRPPFIPNVAHHSLLFRVTPLTSLVHETLQQKLTFVLAPTYKLLEVLGRSFTEGTQTRFFRKAYEQATNGATVTLVRNVWSRNEAWIKALEEEVDKDDKDKKKGGGGEVDGEGGKP